MLMIRYERNNLTQNVTQLRERYKAIQDMIADAQRSPDDYLGQNGDDKNNDIDDIDDIDDIGDIDDIENHLEHVAQIPEIEDVVELNRGWIEHHCTP